MNIENKQRIIDNLLENKFDVEKFKDFTANILNLSVKNRRPYDSIYKVFREYIETYQEISEVVDKDGNKFYVLAVKIKKELDPVRARIKQREFIANILRERKRRGALVAFFNEEYPHWRISFIKLDYEFTAKGFEEKVTPAKRLSYVVGEGEACKTAKDQFFSLTKLEEEVSLNELEEIFALEKVTNDFFKEYKNKYLDIKELLIKDDVFMTEAKKHDMENPESFAEGFAKKLMGQLAFLYFLQKKGWLGVKIVPETLNQQQFDRFYNRALNIEKDVLEKVYNKVSSDLYELRKDELNDILSKEEIDLLASPFRNTEYFNEWGTGDKKFIRNLFELHKTNDINNEKTFFDDYLEILFYNNLSKDRGEIQYSLDFNSRIPFLNGGLFDPYGDYDWQTTSFNLSDDIFSNKDKTGILDIFDIYNFTINENDSYETEVAVDPEMLGKVFENLLDISDRKSKGAFYTPREIVRYMTNESMMNYLLTNLEGKNISKEDLEYLFNFGEFTKEYDQQIFEKDYIKDGKPLTRDIFGMPRNIITNSILIDDLLAKVKIADPACGSGAFPLGILNEIVRARNILTFYINMIEVLKEKDEKNYWRRIDKKQRARKLYNLKLYTIQNCLHGVDIEPSAIDITKLRLWLSILVDSDNDNVKPLPNLDFNFMIGNSLVDEFEGMKLFDESLLKIDEFSEEASTKQHKLIQDTLFKTVETRKQDILKDIFRKQTEYFNEKNTDKKKELKKEVESLENTLIEVTLTANGNEKKLEEIKKGRKERRKPYFLWKLEFAKVFKENNGFDIVIGNPPYVQLQKIKEMSETLKTLKYETYKSTGDLYCLFFEKGVNILKNKGVLSFITSNKWLRADYGKVLRNYFIKNTNPQILIDLGSDVFETATVDTSIFILEKEIKKENKFLVLDISKKENFFNLNSYRKEMVETSFKLDEVWTIGSIAEKNLKEKIEKIGTPLKNWNIRINYGVKTGLNEAYLINKETKEKIIKEDINSKNIIKPVLRGRDIRRYFVEFADLYLINFHNGFEDIDRLKIEDYPAIKKHLDFYYEKLEKRSDKGKTPYNLRNCAYINDLEREKIVYSEIVRQPQFYLDNGEYYAEATSFLLTGENLHYLVGMLNSFVTFNIFKKFYAGGGLGKDGVRYKKKFLENLPIPKLTKEEAEKFIEITDKILELKKLNKETEELEKELDEMVCILYEFTEEEKELIRNF